MGIEFKIKQFKKNLQIIEYSKITLKIIYLLYLLYT